MKDSLTDDSLLTLADLAKHLQCNARTVRRMVADGECPPPFKLGGATRWRWGTIREWIRAVELVQAIRKGSVESRTKADSL